jgi:hypothetical protein
MPTKMKWSAAALSVAALALAGGTVAGAQSGDDKEHLVNRTGVSDYAKEAGGQAKSVGTFSTEVATIAVTDVSLDGKRSSVCVSVQRTGGGSTAGCRQTENLDRPLVGVARSSDGFVVTGIAPSTSGSARLVDGAGRTLPGGQTIVSARTGEAVPYEPVAVAISEKERDVTLVYADRTSGKVQSFPLSATIKALLED